MNLKWFGSMQSKNLLLLALCMATLLSCTGNKVKGDPKKTLQLYVTAVKNNDFKAIYGLNLMTVRHEKYVGATSVGDVEKQLKQNYENELADYEATGPTFTPNVHWAEKHFFPSSCEFELSPIRSLTAAAKDEPNALYEEGFLVIATVSARYPNIKEAPELDGKKISFAKYDCSLGKIREAGNVRIYDLDDKWYFGGCIINGESVEYHMEQSS